ncbi:MAG: cytochrome c biogenesis protein CcdA [Tepidisphaerales bacterium]
MDGRRALHLVFSWLVLLLLSTNAALGQLFAGPSVTVRAELNTTALVAGSQQVLAVVVDVPRGYHAQSARPSSDAFIPFEVRLEAAEGVRTFPVVYPPGEDKTYPLLGTLNVYEGRVVAYVPLMLEGDALPTGSEVSLRGVVTTQLCDDSTCFPPQDTRFEKVVRVASPGEAAPSAEPELFARFDWSTFGQALPGTESVSGRDTAGGGGRILGLTLRPNDYPLAFAVALLVGVIFNVMPCVLPVLPLKAYGFYEAAQHSRGKSLLLGVVFSLGVVAVFGVLGVVVFVGGQQWGGLFQYGWFTWSMVVILVLLSLGLWNVYTFRLPMGVYSFEPRHDTMVGNFLFGGLTALLSTPCTAPLFPALLLWASAQPKAVGLTLMLTVGVGMALPYLLLAAFPGLAKRFPRTGPWSELVKQFMGFLVLGTAAFLAGQALLPGMQFMWLIAATAVAAAVFLVVKTWALMPRPLPMAVAAVLAVLLASSTLYSAAALNRKGVEWVAFSDDALADARARGKTVLVKFTANWCINCHYVERTVFTDRDVLATLRQKDVVLLKVDITRPGAPGSELLRQLNPAGGIPLTAIYFPGESEPLQLASIYTPGTLVEVLTSPPAR